MDYDLILLITCDALRADAIFPNYNYTPNIYRLAKNSVVFLNMFSNGPITPCAFPAIMTSYHFFYHFGIKLNPRIKLIAEFLTSCGFLTFGFNTNPYLLRRFGYSKGFFKYYDIFPSLKDRRRKGKKFSGRFRRFLFETFPRFFPGILKKVMRRMVKEMYYHVRTPRLPYVEAKYVTDLVIKCISKRKNKKLFIWVHYMDTHCPHAPPEEYLPKDFSSKLDAMIFHCSLLYTTFSKVQPYISKKDIIKLKKLYYAELRYIDAQIGRLINYLEENGLIEKSLIIITSDHGEAFYEHSYINHEFCYIHNEVLKVPCIIYDNENSGTFTTFIFSVDILPTLLSYLGLKKKLGFKGLNLRKYYEEGNELGNNRIEYADSALWVPSKSDFNLNKPIVAVINYPWKLIYDSVKHKYELYNLARDPYERRNLIDVEHDVAEFLKRNLKRHLIEAKIFRTITKI